MGITHIDSNTYTQRNGEFSQSLMQLYYVTSDKNYWAKAQKILRGLFTRKSDLGLYYHGLTTRQIWSLKDQVAVAEALIEQVKASRKNLVYQRELKLLVTALRDNYLLANGAAKSFVGENGLAPAPILDENIKLARIFNWYSKFAADQSFEIAAKSILKFLLQPTVMETYYNEPAILLLNKELNEEPFHYL